VAGDDTLIIMERDCYPQFANAVSRVYYESEAAVPSINGRQCHGLGLQIKSLQCTNHTIDFLSKIGYVDRRHAIFTRNFVSSILGASVTSKLDGNLTSLDHATAITQSIAS
jgi:hypothetical protein